MNPPKNHSISAALCAATLIAFAGCKTPVAESLPSLATINRHMPWSDGDAPREGVPTRVMGNWVDAVQYQEGKLPQRGFGGKLIFYDEKGSAPILVDGELVIYGFKEPTGSMPTRRYVFPASDLPKLMSESELGAAYSVWLPWDEAGGPETEVSLVCRFAPTVGPVLVSEQTRQYLKGTKSPADIAADGAKPKMPEGVPYKAAVELASYNAPVGGPAAVAEAALPLPQRTMTSTTIALPESMKNLGPGMPMQHPKPNVHPLSYPATAPPADPAAMRGTGYRLQSPGSFNNGPLASVSTATASTPGFGATGTSAGGLRTAPPSYPPPVTYQETPPQLQPTASPQTPVSIQAMSHGYNNHPLSGPAKNPLTPIGASAGEATVTYPMGR